MIHIFHLNCSIFKNALSPRNPTAFGYVLFSWSVNTRLHICKVPVITVKPEELLTQRDRCKLTYKSANGYKKYISSL